MPDLDKPDTQALILKQFKSIKIALCLVVVMMLLLSGLIVAGGVVVGLAAFNKRQVEKQEHAAEKMYDYGIPADSNVEADHSGGSSRLVLRDEFDGKNVGALPWRIVNEDTSRVTHGKPRGMLTIKTQRGHFHKHEADHKNVFLLTNPLSDNANFEITTCLVGFQPSKLYHQAGLVCWDDMDNYVRIGYLEKEGVKFETLTEEGGVVERAKWSLIPTSQEYPKLWLRIRKEGDSYSCLVSADGTDWENRGRLLWPQGKARFIGFFANNGSAYQAPEIDASFEFFEFRSLNPVD